MRLASKNEILVILGNRAPYFAAFCLAPEGGVLNFLFQNATNYDLDLPAMQGMLNELYTGGVIDTACLERFAAFGLAPEPVPPTGPFRYRVPADYPLPVGATSEPDYAGPYCVIITVPTAIPGRESL